MFCGADSFSDDLLLIKGIKKRLAAVIPAQAGIHHRATGKQKINKAAEIHQWLPACAGMTVTGISDDLNPSRPNACPTPTASRSAQTESQTKPAA
ncbi:hypothetical protein COH98_00565 [Neisseria meningitidis]|nr:hypothetical protein COH98_00565 [Neisseria meningitidis]